MSLTWHTASRILCVRLDNLGDVLMTTPAIRALKHAGPHDRHVTLLGSAGGCAIAGLVPEIDAALSFDAPWVAAGRSSTSDLDIVGRLADGAFDAAVIFTCYSQSALPAAMLCAQAGIPLRLAHCRENPYALLTDWVRDPEPQAGIRHEVVRQLALVGAVGAAACDERLSVEVDAAADVRVRTLLATHGIAADRPYLVVHPGATAASRRWPAGRFGSAAAAIARLTGLPVLVTGTSSDGDLATHVIAAAREGPAGRPDPSSRIVDLTGRIAIDEMVALVAGAALLVSNNSGPVHIAAACGTPVVDLYALTNPQHTPWQVPHRVLSKEVPCANCQRSVCPEMHHACLTGVPVEDVVAAALDLLDETGCERSCEPPAARPRAAVDAPSLAC